VASGKLQGFEFTPLVETIRGSERRIRIEKVRRRLDL
jgi:hypothetical protein